MVIYFLYGSKVFPNHRIKTEPTSIVKHENIKIMQREQRQDKQQYTHRHKTHALIHIHTFITYSTTKYSYIRLLY